MVRFLWFLANHVPNLRAEIVENAVSTVFVLILKGENVYGWEERLLVVVAVLVGLVEIIYIQLQCHRLLDLVH